MKDSDKIKIKFRRRILEEITIDEVKRKNLEACGKPKIWIRPYYASLENENSRISKIAPKGAMAFVLGEFVSPVGTVNSQQLRNINGYSPIQFYKEK